MTTPAASGDSAEHSVSTNERHIETTRSITGLLAVVTGDVVIAVAAIIAVFEIQNGNTPSSAIVSILTSGFTAIATLTTAYFGIRGISNTAQNSVNQAARGATRDGVPRRDVEAPGQGSPEVVAPPPAQS